MSLPNLKHYSSSVVLSGSFFTALPNPRRSRRNSVIPFGCREHQDLESQEADGRNPAIHGEIQQFMAENPRCNWFLQSEIDGKQGMFTKSVWIPIKTKCDGFHSSGDCTVLGISHKHSRFCRIDGHKDEH